MTETTAASEPVRIVHPASPDAEPGTVTRQQYDAVWKAKGWTIAGELSASDTETTGDADAAPNRGRPRGDRKTQEG